jgi:riboflavin kinase/FMN adenylyltransferase
MPADRLRGNRRARGGTFTAMKTLDGLDGLRSLPPGAVVSIGNFDGFHRGHAEILRVARGLRDAAPGCPGVAVATFEPHPLTVLRPQAVPPRLTPPEMKRDLLERAGADFCVRLAPSHDVLDLSAEQFWAVLRDAVRPAHLVEGGTFTFGKARGGTIRQLREWTAPAGIGLHVVGAVAVPLLNLSVVPVSSSLIRWLLSYGRVRDAAICLGRAYALEGEVVPGHQRGRTIGVPTANLRVTDQMVPDDGVYAGRCTVDGTAYPAAVSIGTMPTFGENARQVEAFLIGYTGDLYGRTLRVELVDWVREQWKLPGIEALKAQIGRDVERVREVWNAAPERTIVRAEA